MSQGERGLPGLPGDVVSTRKRPAAHGKLSLRYNIKVHIFSNYLVFDYSRNIYRNDELVVIY